MGRAARSRAERLLTWAHSAERLERLYLGLVTAEPESSRAAKAVDCVHSVDIA
jgi:hypothetical protein